MKISKRIGLIVVGYFVTGALLSLTQLGLSKLFESPSCNGIPAYVLLASYSRDAIDLENLQKTGTEKPESLQRYLLRFGRSLARWLPILFQEVVVGKMTARNYLIGGFRCYNYPFTPSSEGLPPKVLQNEFKEPIEAHDVWKTEDVPKDSRKP